MGVLVDINKVTFFPRGRNLGVEIYFLDETGIVIDDNNKPLYILCEDVK